MPNGHANEPQFADLIADYDRFFEPVAAQVNDFADTHNLLVEKYYHDSPTLSLRFAHPRGGLATLEVSRDAHSGKLCISASWCVDDYDSFSRSIRSSDQTMIERSSPELMLELEKYLGLVLSWTLGQWTQVVTGYKGIWDKTWTKAQFEQLARQWPSPK